MTCKDFQRDKQSCVHLHCHHYFCTYCGQKLDAVHMKCKFLQSDTMHCVNSVFAATPRSTSLYIVQTPISFVSTFTFINFEIESAPATTSFLRNHIKTLHRQLNNKILSIH